MSTNNNPTNRARTTRALPTLTALLLATLLTATHTPAAPLTWDGPANGDWFDPTHWNPDAPPTPADQLNIPALATPIANAPVVTDAFIRTQGAPTFNSGVFINAAATFQLFAGSLTTTSLDDSAGGTYTDTAATTLTLTDPAGAITTDNTDLLGDITGVGGLTKIGLTTLTLSGTNTYTGPTQISAGTLTPTAAAALPADSPITINALATLDLSAAAFSLASLAGDGDITLDTHTLTIGSADTPTTFAGTISGNAGLTKTGAATLTLSGANTYTGQTTITAGTLTPTTAAALPTNSDATVVAAATLDLTADAFHLNSLSGAGDVLLNAGDITIGLANTSTTFSGNISGPAGLTKTGTGTLTLNNNNTYAATTTVTQGTLLIDTPAGTLPNTSDLTISGSTSPTLTLQNQASATTNNALIGDTQVGNLNLLSGATLLSDTATIADTSSSGINSAALIHGTAPDDSPSTWTNTGDLTIANNGKATLTIQAGAQVTANATTVARDNLVIATILVDGQDADDNPSQFITTNLLTLGVQGRASLTVQAGARTAADSLLIGQHLLSKPNTVLIDGVGSNNDPSRLDVTNTLTLADAGRATLTVQNGAHVNAATATLANSFSSQATLNIDGADLVAGPSTVDIDGPLTIGLNGGDTHVNVTNGAQLHSNSATVSHGGGIPTRSVLIDGATPFGAPSKWTNTNQLDIGFSNQATLTIQNGGHVQSDTARIGAENAGDGTVTVDGINPVNGQPSRLTVTTATTLGDQPNSNGTLNIQNGAHATTSSATLGNISTADATLNIDGTDSTFGRSLFDVQGQLNIGLNGADASITVTSGAELRSDGATITSGALTTNTTPRTILVDGLGFPSTLSKWTNDGPLDLGVNGPATLTLSNRGQIFTESASLGVLPDGHGNINIDDHFSVFKYAGPLIVGDQGNGSITLDHGDLINLTLDPIIIANQPNSTGSVTATGVSAQITSPGHLTIGNSGDAELSILDDARVTADGFDMAVNPDSHGTLLVSGRISDLVANNGGVIAGHGTADITINDGATLRTNMVTSNGVSLSTQPDGVATILIDGVGSDGIPSVWFYDSIFIGVAGSASVTADNGAVLSGNGSVDFIKVGIANAPSNPASLTIRGTDPDDNPSELLAGVHLLEIGEAAVGSLHITQGALAEIGPTTLGRFADGDGTLLVEGASPMNTPSNLLATQDLIVGDEGTANFNIKDGAQALVTNQLTLGKTSGTGNVLVDGSDPASGPSTLTTAQLTVGDSGNATLTVTNGANLVTAGTTIAQEQGSNGDVTISGTDDSNNPSTWDLQGFLFVGSAGTGSLSIQSGVQVESEFTALGVTTDGDGTLSIDGTSPNNNPSMWSSSGELQLGAQGAAQMQITGGAHAQASQTFMALGQLSFGQLTVSGTDSLLNPSMFTSPLIFIADSAIAEFNILAGGLVNTDTLTAGNGIGSHATVVIDSAGSNAGPSTLNIQGIARFGSEGTAVLNILNGAQLDTPNNTTFVADRTTSQATVLLSGTDALGNPARWSARSIIVGHDGTATFNIEDGAAVEVDENLWLSNDSPFATSTLVVQGADPAANPSRLIITQSFTTGANGADATFEIRDGAHATTNGHTHLAAALGGNTTVTIEGGGTPGPATWTANGLTAIGGTDLAQAGNATVNLNTNALLDLNANLILWPTATININSGTLQIQPTATIDPKPRSVINFNAGLIHALGDYTIDKPLTDAMGAHLQAGATLAVSGTATFDTPFTLFGGNLTVADITNLHNLSLSLGHFTVSDSDLTIPLNARLDHSAAVTVSNGQLLLLENATINSSGPLTAQGGDLAAGAELNLTGSATFNDALTINPTAQLNTINATLTFPGDGTPNDDGLVNLGTLNLINTTINGDVRSPAGSNINVAAGVTFNGLVSGAANFPGAALVTFNGGYDPGDSPAAINFAGPIAFGPNATLHIELGGLTPGPGQPGDTDNGYDQLIITANATLDGTLDIQLINNFDESDISPFDIFTILTWATNNANTTFDTINLPALPTTPGLSLTPTYNPTNFQLTANATPGDANLDGLVDLLDLVILAANFQQDVGQRAWRQADFNLDTVVDATDLQLAAPNFTGNPDTFTTLANSLGVQLTQQTPEPTTLLTLLLLTPLLINPPRRVG